VSTGNRFSFSIEAIVLVLFGYSSKVFPNLQYNLGGGQPRLVQLELDHKDLVSLSTFGVEKDNTTDKVSKDDVIKTIKDKNFISMPVAIWYQSSDFFYFIPLSDINNETNRLTAIAKNRVHGIRYLANYVRVDSDGRIRTILPLPN
jgi:hypothetical protein